MGIAASSAVMLTDIVPGGTVTKRDGLRHNCPINTSKQLSRVHAQIRVSLYKNINNTTNNSVK